MVDSFTALKDKVAIRDQLGEEPSTNVFGVWDYNETIRVVELPTLFVTETLGHAWIVGSPTNGLVGVNTATEDGQQQTVGGAGRTDTDQNVVCPNNLFKDFIRDTILWDTANSTATISSTTFDITFTAGQLALCKMFSNTQTVTSATLELVGNLSSNDLSAYFSFDAGSSVDDSANSNDGTDTDMTYATGIIGKGAVFNGSTSKVDVGNPAELRFGTSDFSISLWVKLDAYTAAGNQMWINKENTSTNRYAIFWNGSSDTITAEVADGTTNVNIDSAANAIADNLWHHIVLTVDRANDEAKIYVDGAQSGSTTDISAITGNNISPTANFYLGSQTGASEFLDGNLDDVAVYLREITDTEIARLYNSGLGRKGSIISFTWEMSADDKSNFEAVEIGEAHQFTNTGQVLWLRVTCPAAQTLDIDDSNGRSTPVQVRFNI